MSYRPLESCGPSSYVLLTGSPSASTCTTFGLTPKELRYLQVHNAPAISIQLPVVKKAHKIPQSGANRSIQKPIPAFLGNFGTVKLVSVISFH